MSTVSTTNPRRTAYRLARQISRLQRLVTRTRRNDRHEYRTAWLKAEKRWQQALIEADYARRQMKQISAIAYCLLQQQGGSATVGGKELADVRPPARVESLYDVDLDQYTIRVGSGTGSTLDHV